MLVSYKLFLLLYILYNIYLLAVFFYFKISITLVDEFILEKKLRWIPYNKFKSVEYLDKGGFGTIYKAIWSNYDGDREVILKCHSNLNENLDEFLNEWKYHGSCLGSYEIINFYGFTKNPNTSKYMAVMDYANKDLMKKCWDEDPLKRPSSKEVSKIIKEWIFLPYGKKIEDINEELKCNIMEFINAPIGHNNNLATESHPQAFYTSRLLNFTSKQLNEILESENSQTSVQVSEMLVSKDLNECMIDSKTLDIKTNEN
ncbi:uncharacterized protein OCT59_009071 [Rhizophagus irregularis]|uniref:uncharacterized protein n=1 Tax=Rhizophagus irregularis TaxID=588596 RepID=UPI00332615D8|nr:hypothetical protein OCT59_009071 [Rhizophagus irregularis]